MPGSARVRFRPQAEQDLLSLYHFIVADAGRARAEGYLRRIQSACMGLELFPERGLLREDLGPGVRVLGFERRVAIAFRQDGPDVEILRIFYGGQDLERAFGTDDAES